MVYHVTDDWYVGSKRVFQCKDTSGMYVDLMSADIKRMMKKGDKFPDLTLTADKKLIVNRRKQSAAKIMKPSPIDVNMSGYQIFTGNALVQRVRSWVQNMHRRFAVIQILNRLSNYEAGKVCVIKGIRRTGKTTAIMHTIESLLKSGVSADAIGYITITSETANTDEVIAKIGSNYWEYVFVDEITLLSGLLSKLKIVADVIAGPKKVVLTGTDSYIWPVAATDVLYGRQALVDLTYMSFNEYCAIFPDRVNGLNKQGRVENFCRFGGVLSKTEYATMQEAYTSVQSALVGNIVNTILKNKENPSVKAHVGELYAATREQLMEAVISAILIAARTQGGTSSKLEGIKIPELAAGILEKQGTHKSARVSEDVLKRLVTALIELNVLDKVDNIAQAFEAGAAPQGKTVFICHIGSLYNVIIGAIDDTIALSGEAFENLILSQCVQFAKTEAFRYVAAGKAEDVAVRHCRYTLTKDLLEKYGERNETPEIDVIVQRRYSGGVQHTCVIDAKLSNQPKSSHAQNMFLETMDKALGKIDKYLIVYTGETRTERNVHYVNAHDFLMDIGKWVL
jgi:predicted AAA+ superfamily ATPase